MECKNNSCFYNTLKVIEVLQDNANKPCSNNTGCGKPYLGEKELNICYNTRPITFFTCNGQIFTVTLNDQETQANIFRIEKVYDNCVKLLILIPKEEPTENEKYQSTNEYITLSLDCICAIQCLKDQIIELNC